MVGIEECSMTEAYRFEFDESMPLQDVEATLLLAGFSVEGIYGRARVRLEMSYDMDEAHRAIVVKTPTEVGVAIAQVFTALVQREFGENAADIRPVRTSAVDVASGKAA